MPLALRVFEPRYLKLMGDLVGSSEPHFGVPLWGQSVPAGVAPARRTVGTLAVVDDFGMTDEFFGITATGTQRYEITTWLEADPYPLAEVRLLPELHWSDDLLTERLSAELAVRSLLRRAAQFGELQWDSDDEISDDPVQGAWQLAGFLPVGVRDQLDLLESETCEELLQRIIAVSNAGEAYLDKLETEEQ
jgi:Lon protease-like protein